MKSNSPVITFSHYVWIVFESTPRTLSLGLVEFMVDTQNLGFNMGFYKYFAFLGCNSQ